MKVETSGDGYFVRRSEVEGCISSLEADHRKLEADSARDPGLRDARICTFSLLQWLRLKFPASGPFAPKMHMCAEVLLDGVTAGNFRERMHVYAELTKCFIDDTPQAKAALGALEAYYGRTLREQLGNPEYRKMVMADFDRFMGQPKQLELDSFMSGMESEVHNRTLSRGVTATQNTAPTEESPGTSPDGAMVTAAAKQPGRMKALARKRLPFSNTGLTHQECGGTIITIRGKYYCPGCEEELVPGGEDD